MNRILLVSDSHGATQSLQEIKKMHEKEVDLMIHCGDSELSEEDPAMFGYMSVKGNCDFLDAFPDDEIHEVGRMKIFVTHGHLYSVKSTLMNLYYKAKEAGANIVCFGHSHVLGMEMIDDLLFINPGSIRLPRGRMEQTYVIMEIEDLNVRLMVHEYGRGEIAELRQEFTLHKLA